METLSIKKLAELRPDVIFIAPSLAELAEKNSSHDASTGNMRNF